MTVPMTAEYRKELIDGAAELLDPANVGVARISIEEILPTLEYFSTQPVGAAGKAREDLKGLRAALESAAKISAQLSPLAVGAVRGAWRESAPIKKLVKDFNKLRDLIPAGASGKLAPAVRGLVDVTSWLWLFETLADICRRAETSDVIPRPKGGRPVGYFKRYVAWHCYAVLEQHRGVANTTDEEFCRFCSLVHELVTGPADIDYERAVRWVTDQATMFRTKPDE